jgi:hypothetical protein
MDDLLAQVIALCSAANADHGGSNQFRLKDRLDEIAVLICKGAEHMLGKNPRRPVKQKPRDGNSDLLIFIQLEPPLHLPIKRAGQAP